MKRKPTMTSREAAALLLSGGATDDADLANQMEAGEILDPDALERAYYRRIFGFDLTVTIDPKKHKAIVKDEDLGLVVTTGWSDDNDEVNASKLAKACVKLKAKHENVINTPEGETDADAND